MRGSGRHTAHLGPIAVLFALLLVTTSPSHAAEALHDDGVPIDTIVVTSPRVEKNVLEVPAAVTVIDKRDIQLARPQLTLGESLAGVPGVFTQNRSNFAQDLRISIRGFGSRANFGIRGIKLVVDGIPATLPDGQGQVDSLQLATAGRIEVMRGPSGSLYGSAAGGIILVESEKAPATPFVEGRAAFGSYGYRGYDVKGAGRAGAVSYLLGYSRRELDGYREHSKMESNTLNSRLHWDIDESSDLTALAAFVNSPLANDPGALTESEVEADRRQAAPNNLLYDAGEELNQFNGGLRYRRRYGEKHETTAAGYFVWRDFSNRLPFQNGGAVSFDRLVGGGSLQHSYSDQFSCFDNRLLVGFDADAQRDDRQRRDNDFGETGSLRLDQREEVTSLRGFVRDELRLCSDVELTVAVGYDHLDYEVHDHYLGDGDDDSGARTFSEWTPMVGLRWSPLELVNPYFRYSTSFEPPSTTELARADGGGGFNQELEPQRAMNLEVGLKGLLPGRLRYELAGYYIRMNDELVAFEIPGEAGRSYFENAGRSTRGGLEVGLAATPVEGVVVSLAYTFSVSEFEEFESDDGDFGGNQIPGVPNHVLNTRLDYNHPWGFFGAFELRYIGEFYADSANQVESAPYVVGDLRLGWQGRFGGWEFTPYVGLDNFWSTEYIDNLRINANPNFGRYFEPAPERSVYGGLSVAYHFQ